MGAGHAMSAANAVISKVLRLTMAKRINAFLLNSYSYEYVYTLCLAFLSLFLNFSIEKL